MKKQLLPFFALILIMVGCKKPTTSTPTPQNFNASNPSPTFPNADGLLASVTTLVYQSTPVGEFATEADVATAAFFNTSTTFYEGGTVSVNSNDLEMQANNAYVSVSQNATKIDLGFGSSGNEWSVAGGANVPAFNHTTSRGMPSNIKFSAESETVNTANNFTVGITSAPNTCDSILYVLAAENKTVTKTVSRTTTSVTFNASDMSGLSGSGVVQVAAYNYEFSTENGKNMYYINEKVITDLVTFE